MFNSGDRSGVLAKARDIRVAGRPLFIIGHSWGGQLAIDVAEQLKAEGITPDRVFTIDPFIADGTTIAPGIPLTNFFQQEGLLINGKFPINGRAVVGAEANILVTGTSHFEITEHKVVTEAILTTILATSGARSTLGGRY